MAQGPSVPDYFEQLRQRFVSPSPTRAPTNPDASGRDVSALSFSASGAPVLPSGSNRDDWANIVSSKRFWMPDAVSTDCYQCNLKFNLFRRRHHCRICGQIFCQACSDYLIEGRIVGCTKNIRACKFCYDFFQQPSLTAAEERSLSATNSYHIPGSNGARGGGTRRRNSGMALNSPHTGDHEVQIALDASEVLGSGDVASLENFALKDKRMLKKLMDRITGEGGIEMGAKTLASGEGACHRAFLGSELVQWIREQDNGITDVKLATVVCQGLLDHGYIKCYTEEGKKVFQAGDVPYGPTAMERINSDSEMNLGAKGASGGGGAGSRLDLSFSEDNSIPQWLNDVEETHSNTNTLKRSKELRKISDQGKKNESTSIDSIMAISKNQKSRTKRERQDYFPEILRAYDRFSAQALATFLQEENLDHEKWSKFVFDATAKLAASILPNAAKNDDIDARKYAKIKIIPGGEIKDCLHAEGEIFTNKYATKTMPEAMVDPRILLVRGSIAFDKYKDKYESLEDTIPEEEEYMKNLRKKIIASKCNLLIAEESISTDTRDILMERGVAVFHSVKMAVLQRISRYFGVQILSALTPMTTGRSKCKYFSTERFTMPNGHVKDVVFLEGVSDLGCSILLRGAGLNELRRVKYVIKKLLHIMSNARFESEFLFSCGASPDVEVPVFRQESNYQTISPFIVVKKALSPGEELPVQQRKTPDPKRRNREHLLKKKNEAMQKLVTFFNEDFKTQLENSHFSHTDEEPKDLLAIYRMEANTRSIIEANLLLEKEEEQYYKGRCEDKVFPVLFASFSPHSKASPFYCILPWIVNMHFYGNNDLTLGSFLKLFCFSSTYNCPNEKVCREPIFHHIRRFCHNNGSVTIEVSSYEEPVTMVESKKGDIIMWKFCEECTVTTDLLSMSPNLLSYSFAMFLMLFFYEEKLTRRPGRAEEKISELPSTSSICKHSLMQQHVTCFSFDRYVATFKYEKIYPPRLYLPPKKLTIPKPVPEKHHLTEQINGLSTHGAIIFNALVEEINRLQKYSIETLTLSVQALEEEQRKDHCEFRELMNTLNAKHRSDDDSVDVTIFNAKKHISDSLVRWRQHLNTLQEFGIKEVARSRRESGKEVGASAGDGALGSKFEGLSLDSNNYQTIFSPPFSPTVHYSLGRTQKMEVDESQISSIIAYSISSNEHASFLSERNSQVLSADSDLKKHHHNHEFKDDTCRFFCQSYFAKEFKELRDDVFGEDVQDDFAVSISRCQEWYTSGGKSGSMFYMTQDERFIFKEMSKYEVYSFQNFMRNYFKYVKETVKTSRPSCLAKIFGIYKVGFENYKTNSKNKKDLLVMENVFYGFDIQEKYDLKGSIRNRFVDTSTVEESKLVLWDENLLKVACSKPLYVSYEAKQTLLEAINYDTHFLHENAMMDYSMLVGINRRGTGQMVLGIVDYIRKFSWDKKLEQLVKSTGILGGGGKTPTVVSPNLYMERFKEAMYKYFILVPDFEYKEPCSSGTSFEEPEEEPVR